jgi:hypothetical protein
VDKGVESMTTTIAESTVGRELSDEELVELGFCTEEDLEIAESILELYQMGLIEEVIDEQGTPRFGPTGKLPE